MKVRDRHRAARLRTASWKSWIRASPGTISHSASMTLWSEVIPSILIIECRSRRSITRRCFRYSHNCALPRGTVCVTRRIVWKQKVDNVSNVTTYATQVFSNIAEVDTICYLQHRSRDPRHFSPLFFSSFSSSSSSASSRET